MDSVEDDSLYSHRRMLEEHSALVLYQRMLRNDVRAGLLRLQHTLAATALLQEKGPPPLTELTVARTNGVEPNGRHQEPGKAAEVAPVVAGTPPVDAPAGDHGLTPREITVVRMIAEGLSTKEIAARMGISFKTAVCHRANAMRKLDCHETATLVRHAIRMGLTQP